MTVSATPYANLAAVVRFVTKHERWTRKEFAIGTGIHRRTAECIVTGLHSNGVIYVDEWMDDSLGRASIPVFAIGPGADARKRTALTGKQRTRAYLERKKHVAVASLAQAVQQWRAQG